MCRDCVCVCVCVCVVIVCFVLCWEMCVCVYVCVCVLGDVCVCVLSPACLVVCLSVAVVGMEMITTHPSFLPSFARQHTFFLMGRG